MTNAHTNSLAAAACPDDFVLRADAPIGAADGLKSLSWWRSSCRQVPRQGDEFLNGITSCRTEHSKITAWLAWFAGIVLEAQQRTQAETVFLIGKKRLLADLQGDFNWRQEKVVVRLLRAGAVGFAGGLSAKNYRSITHADEASALRELADLADKGALVPFGEATQGGESQRYQINLPLMRAVRIAIDEQGDVLEM